MNRNLSDTIIMDKDIDSCHVCLKKFKYDTGTKTKAIDVDAVGPGLSSCVEVQPSPQRQNSLVDRKAKKACRRGLIVPAKITDWLRLDQPRPATPAKIKVEECERMTSGKKQRRRRKQKKNTPSSVPNTPSCSTATPRTPGCRRKNVTSTLSEAGGRQTSMLLFVNDTSPVLRGLPSSNPSVLGIDSLDQLTDEACGVQAKK